MVRTDSRDQKLQAFFKPANEQTLPTANQKADIPGNQFELSNQNTQGSSGSKDQPMVLQDTAIPR